MSQLTRIHYFNTVAELGSISAASNFYDIQPSSISRQIAVLEKELGVRLLNRNTRNLGLTEAGRKYFEYSQRIISEIDSAKRAVSDLQDKPRGVLRVSLTVGFGEMVILPLVTRFMEKYPEIKLELELTERVVDMVDENIDIAVRSGLLHDSNLVATHLQDNNFILCASPSYLKKYGVPLSSNELIDHTCLCYGFAGWKEWYLLSDAAQPIPLSNRITINSVNGQKQLIINDSGIALIPRWAVKEDVKQGRLSVIMPSLTFSPSEKLTSTYAIYQNREFVSPKIRVFLDFIKQELLP
ncbi:LysR family transcriptional regulator [Shewanella sp. GutCb]|jgi:DNA-binding transcriptional LysR family regulator|uniref:LysR family transcriptional regulator n=1 Tax=Shewanella sp. GutCb TaxID=2058315 RepID=UPI000C7E327D|nr:LysR family transcriptional regulator [Shewanella sp. GutCb]PKG74089.1 LysR family transcriptional regulator [Shewanella sp. GutCb]